MPEDAARPAPGALSLTSRVQPLVLHQPRRLNHLRTRAAMVQIRVHVRVECLWSAFVRYYARVSIGGQTLSGIVRSGDAVEICLIRKSRA